MPDLEKIPGTLQRSTTCTCGKEFEQEGIDLGSSTIWHPIACTECRSAIEAAQAAQLAAEARAEGERHRSEILKALDVPEEYRGVTLKDFELYNEDPEIKKTQMLILRKGRLFLGTWPNPVLLVACLGEPGTGKTRWAWAIAQEIATEHQSTVIFRTWADIMRDLRGTWRPTSKESEDEVLRRYRRAQLLVIDEVSRHAFYGQPTQHLYDVLADRLQRKRPTIITSNESEQDFQDILGPPLVDRLIHSGGMLDFNWSSYRKRPKGEPA